MRYLRETGEPDQDYDHAFFDAIISQLEDAGVPGATHREFDKYQGTYLAVPGVGTFWIDDFWSSGVRKPLSRGESRSTFTYKPGTRVDHTVFINEDDPEPRLEVTQTEAGDVDASDLVEYCVNSLEGV